MRGHYKSYVKKDDQWDTLDDNMVYAVTWDEVLIGRHIILYTEKKSQMKVVANILSHDQMLGSVY